MNRGIGINGHWYYVDENGKKYVSQFRQKDDTWYYYDENGYLKCYYWEAGVL